MTSTTETRPSARRAAARPDPVAASVLGLLGLLGLAAWELLGWDPLSEIPRSPEGMEGWFFAAQGASPVLVLLLAGWLVWRRRHRLAAVAAHSPGRSWGAAPLLAAAAGMAAWSHYTGAPDLLVPALSLGLLGAGTALAGHGALRVLWFPALFALLALPVPVALANHLLYPMQRLAASGASAFLALVGVPHLFLGDQLYANGKLFYVIETCSGLRSVQTLLLGAALYCELFFRSRAQVLLLVATAPLVALLVNQVRVITIILNPLAHFSTIHTLQGMAMLFAGVFLIAGVDSLHAWATGSGLRPPPSAPSGARPGAFAPRRLILAALGAAVLVPLGLVVPEWEPPPPPQPRVAKLPLALGDWRAQKGGSPDYTFLGSVRFSEWVMREYVHPAHEPAVEVFVAADDHRQRFQGVLSSKVALPGPGWRIGERRRAPAEDGVPAATELWLESRGRRMLSLTWWAGAGSLPEEVLRSALVLDRGPFHRDQRTVAVRLTTEVPLAPKGRERARARVRDLAARVAQALSEREIAASGPAGATAGRKSG